MRDFTVWWTNRVLASMMLAAACTPASDRSASDPVSAAEKFIRLARAGRCEESFLLYTKASRVVLADRSRWMTRDASSYAEEFLPHNLECRPQYAGYQPSTLHEKSRTGDSAVVGAIHRSGSRIPIPFFSDPIKDSPVEIRMAFEDGRWKVTVPAPRQDARRNEAEFGNFTVDWSKDERPGDPRRLFRVMGRMDAAAEDAEAVLLDVDNWSRWMPLVVEARRLGEPDTARSQRVVVRFQAPGDTVSARWTLQFHTTMRTSDKEYKGFSGQWESPRKAVAGQTAGGRPFEVPSLSGTLSWRVDMRVTGPAGLLVQYSQFGVLDEWPPTLAAKVFAPETAAGMMIALENEVRRRKAAVAR